MHPNVEKLLKKTYAEQRSQEWLDLRKNMLTASDAATAIGENKYEKPFGHLREPTLPPTTQTSEET